MVWPLFKKVAGPEAFTPGASLKRDSSISRRFHANFVKYL